MLSTLPSEVILNISSFLDIKDKLTLVKTCRRLHNTISKWNLYQDLSIPTHKSLKTSAIVRKFKNGELNGTQVLKLKLDLSQLSNQLYRRLPVIFPRVTELINLTKDEHTRNDFIIEPLSRWKDTLERYDIEKGYTQIFKLFETHTFSRLKELNISPNKRQAYTDPLFSDKINLEVCLQHLPFLEQLRLYQMEMTIETLEKIHQSCQRLKSLQLANVLVFIEQTYLPDSIEPANHLNSLHLERSTIVCDPRGLFLDYVAAKYPSLSRLFFYFTFNKTNLQLLLQYRLNSDPLDNANNSRRSLLTQGSDFDKARNIYLESGGRFFGTLPKTIKELGINTDLFNNTLDGLTQTNMNLSSLVLADEKGEPATLFKDTLHYDYLYGLTSLTSLSVGFSADIQGYEDNMNVLTNVQNVNLSISAGSGQHAVMKMDWLLSTFPSVKELNILHSDATLMAEGLLHCRTYPRLKKMTIKKASIGDNLLDYLPIMAPGFRQLGWTIGGPAYQFKIPKQYFRDLKAANKAGKKMKDLPEIPDQISHYIDIKRYRLDHFHLWTHLDVNPRLGEAEINVEIVQPTRTQRYIFCAASDGTTYFRRNGEHVQSYQLRQMTKVMVVCNVLKTFQLDYTKVITL